MAYEIDPSQLVGRIADDAHEIFDAAELATSRSTKFPLITSLKLAKALCLITQPALLGADDEVIE
jgi:hypothetical protein